MLISSIIAFVVMVCGGGILVKKLVQKPAEANKYFDDIVELGIQPHRVNYMSHIFILTFIYILPREIVVPRHKSTLS